MTLRQKILLLGLVAIAGMTYALWREFEAYQLQLHATEKLKRNVGAIRSLSTAIHELQKERGLTTTRGLGDGGQALAAQVRVTDGALPALAHAETDVGQLGETVASLRQSVAARTIDLLAARDAYSKIIQSLLDAMDRLTPGTGASIGDGSLMAHGHLVAAKEYLGQIRATVGYWIDRKDRGQAFQNLIHLHSMYDEEMRKFGINASPELRTVFEQRFSGAAVDDLFRSLAAVKLAGHPPPGLAAPAWWAMATEAIDRLKDVETASLGLIERNAAEQLARSRKAMGVGVAINAALGIAVLVLAVSATVSLLRALDRALTSIDRISASKDFSTRIPVESPDEIGRISRSFNELLEIAERLLKEKDYLANTDGLTGISNRLRLSQVFRQETERKLRNQAPMALVLFDIDYFKRMNDTYGHNAGDDVLRGLARLVSGEIRRTDVFGRWGGEEFVLLLQDDDCDAAMKLAEKLRARIADHEFPEVGRLTCSFGVAAFEPGDTETALVARADKALYEAKRAGRNQVRCERSTSSECLGRSACEASVAPVVGPV